MKKPVKHVEDVNMLFRIEIGLKFADTVGSRPGLEKRSSKGVLKLGWKSALCGGQICQVSNGLRENRTVVFKQFCSAPITIKCPPTP